MTLAPRFTRLLLLVSALASFVSASPTNSLFVRDSQCAAGLESCPASLPNNFCCSQGTTCLPLAGNTTALCCPTGQTCEKIQPITCDISLQDPIKNSQSPIKTSVFDVSLGKCGGNLCCPFGYSCVGGNQCQKDADQSKSPESAGSSATGSPTSTSPTSGSPTSPASATSAPASATSPPATSLVIAPVNTAAATPPAEETSLPSTTSSPDSSSTETASPAPKASNPKTISIVAGVVGGCAVLAALGIIAFLFVRRRNRYSESEYPEKANIKHLGPGPGLGIQGGSVISDPILQPNSYRADFIRKTPSIRSFVSQRPPRISYQNRHSQRLSIPNPFDSPNPSDHSPTNFHSSVCSEDELNARTGVVESGSRLAPIRAMKASSTRVYPQNVPREPSGGESINVFADPVMMRGSYDKRQTQGTTFTDLMMEADLDDVRRGHPYVVHDPMPPARI
ncbi:uncharacterized protein TrAFT101_003771 [Trichoderma asperellum]|uniref:Mid2 domain-containing protein n=1 Tax=Trichoderma asperellum (strain ATCC 204424 / CBS 433.97 / NBRC 101777) TaxID=1042311 RepID=A0A2T3ZPQ5_TRIA4|nr:hypothetical protein M441DRAFT_64050 [Trichoderma asperellum CBS 433.97]PTB46786.1 hypothetical protein M441DRAFT_64050 [Trichoderma asperellum CBS 433.97]UKZ88004.1 hypothetical protein TrAFT101_003771 [Trichoderma asperellum]